MSSNHDDLRGPCWETMISPCRDHDVSARHRPRLQKALLTTFEPPDPTLLTEDLLPVWLGLNRRDPGDTNKERYLFYGELHDALKRVRNNISVFHSYRPSFPSPSWLWRQVRTFPVGRDNPARQHAKLWMFHWTDDGEGGDWLELLVSSSNLTRAAFRDQLQAAWRAIVPIAVRGTRTNTENWGMLSEFLMELGRSAGPDGEATVAEWVTVLGRTECPADVDLIASVPGDHSSSTLRRSSTAWGVAGLANIDLGERGNVGVDVFVPTVGTWNDAAWSNWLARAGLSGDAVSLAWVDGNHPWGKDWVLPKASRQTFDRHEVSFRAIPAPGTQNKSWLHDRHVPRDPRWSHAKAYWFRRGRRRKILVTSANLSPAAWGALASGGGLRIENFELGVAVTCAERPIEVLPVLEEPCVVDAEATDVEGIFAWAAASWDGRRLMVQCRLGTKDYQLNGAAKICLLERKDQEPKVELKWTASSPAEAFVRWDGGLGVPISIRMSATPTNGRADGEQQCEVPVADLRTDEQAENTPCPEIPEQEREAVELALLLERYGRVDAEEVAGDVAAAGIGNGSLEGGPADYEVAVIQQSRRYWEVVDGWAAAYARAAGTERQFLLHDGRRLCDYWRRAAANAASAAVGVAAGLAAEELSLRLED